MARVRLGYGHVTVGRPLPFNIMDEGGRILLSHGYVIASQDQLDRLIEREVYFDRIEEDAPAASESIEKVSIYLRTAAIANDFHALFGNAEAHPDYRKIPAFAQRIQEICELDCDPAMACILLHKTDRYSLRHSFSSAILTEVLLKQLGVGTEDRRQAVAGALTMNVAMLALQDTLYHQNAPLEAEQKRNVVMHPAAAAAILRQQGIDHPIWLDVVEHHHEMIDGSGYAKRLKGESLSLPAQVVSLADRYCAMVSERGYRPASLPSVAAKELLTRQGATIETTLAAQFIREVGIYPPGTVVSLANGEVAVVVKRTLNPASPVARALRAPSGVRHATPPKRLTSKPAYAIKEVLGCELAKDFDLSMLWPPAQLEGG
ncbi:MAG: HD domain-containing protein, partial [Rhodocyclaceae bacterium]